MTRLHILQHLGEEVDDTIRYFFVVSEVLGDFGVRYMLTVIHKNLQCQLLVLFVVGFHELSKQVVVYLPVLFVPVKTFLCNVVCKLKVINLTNANVEGVFKEALFHKQYSIFFV